MKKTFAVLLAAVLAVTALCACLTVSAESTNLALGKTFIGADPTSGNQYTDKYNAKLNDGLAETEPNWAESPDSWFAFYYNSSLPSNAVATEDYQALATFTIDLDTVSSIDCVRIHMVTSGTFDGSGVVAPLGLKVEYSSDNSSWATLNELNGMGDASDFSGYKDIDWVEVKGDSAVDARYIRVSIKFRGYTFMLNEVQVMSADTASGSETTDAPASSEPAASSEPTDSSADSASSTETSAPAASSAAPTSSAPTTGDAGLIGFAVLAVVALAGTVVAVKVRH